MVSLKYIETRVYATLAHLYSLVGWLKGAPLPPPLLKGLLPVLA